MNISYCLKKIILNCCRETHTSTCTRTGRSVIFSSFLCGEEYDVGNFLVTLGSTWGYFHVCRHSHTCCSFFTGLQVHYICVYDIQCILHVLDTAFFNLLFLTLVLPSFKLCLSLIDHGWVLSLIPSPLLSGHACICLDCIQCPHFGGICCHTLPLFYVITLAAVCLSPNKSFYVE